MPRIIVTADRPADTVMLSERITSTDFESEHFCSHLTQRLAWAVADAHLADQGQQDERDGGTWTTGREPRDWSHGCSLGRDGHTAAAPPTKA
jgi:hypothetical protein